MVGAAGNPSAHSSPRAVDARLLTLVTGRVNRDIGVVLAREDLSVDQWRVLDYLHDAGPCTMTGLGEAIGTSGATLTRVVDRLVSRVLIYRNADSGDRRRVLVHLSERGRQATEDLRPQVRAAEELTIAELNATERDELARLLQRIAPVPDPGS